MAHVDCVNVLNTCYQVLVESAGLSLTKSLFGHNVIKQLSSMAILHDHIVLCLCFYDLIVMYTYLVQLCDVWMVNERENLDLSLYSFHIILLLDP